MKNLICYRGNLPSKKTGWSKEKAMVGLMWEILTRLNRKNVELDVLCFGDLEQPLSENYEGIKIRRVFDKKNIFGEIRTGIIISFLSSLKLLKRRYDIFHIVGEPMWHAGGIFIAKLVRTPIVLTFLDPWYPLSKYEFSLKKHSLKQKIFYFFEVEILAKFLEKLFSLFASKIICISERLKIYLIKRGVDKEKIKVIPNGVNIELFNPEKYPHQFNYTLGYLGSIYSIHGIFKILNAFQ